MLNQTALWYKKRQKFVLGPDLPNYFSPMTLQLYKNICSVSLNSTHVMLFGFLVDEGYTIHQYKGVAIIEFSRNIWTNLAPLPIEYHESIKNVMLHQFLTNLAIKRFGLSHINTTDLSMQVHGLN